jgi:deoxyribonuclease IV
VLVGDGQIGAAPFGWLLGDRRSHGIPLILETPQLAYDVGDDDPTPDPWDLQMMAQLRELAGT